MVHLSNFVDVIGEPMFVKKKSKRQLSLQNAALSSSKNLQTTDIHNTFMDMHSENEQESDNPSTKYEIYVPSENCNNIPCDWTHYGPSIVGHVNDIYAGCLMVMSWMNLRAANLTSSPISSFDFCAILHILWQSMVI